MKSYITTTFFLIFLLLVAIPAHAEDIYEPDYADYNKDRYSETTDIVNSDFVVRMGGTFKYLIYSFSKQFEDDPEPQNSNISYMAPGGNISLYYCKNIGCFGIDQDLATVYTYKGSGNHFYGATHIAAYVRFLRANRLLLEPGIALGVAYASNSNNIEEKVFRGCGIAFSAKIPSFSLTIFINRFFGIGLYAALDLLYDIGVKTNNDGEANGNNDATKNKKSDIPLLFGFDAGIHLMIKY